MPTRRSRAENRAEMEAAILRAARTQLAQRGAAALSLREVARELGVVSSAVYRYVASRDELLTLLLVDAYTVLADEVEAAVAAAGAASPLQRVEALALAMRRWACSHPEQWALVYGSPVPGYEAPSSQTTPAGVRVMALLLRELAELPATGDPPPLLHAYLDAGLADLGVAASAAQAELAVRVWCLVVGTISMELFGQLGPEVQATPGLGEEILVSQLRAVMPRAT